MPAPTSSATPPQTTLRQTLRPLVESHLVDLWPEAGRAVGVRSRSAALRALNKLEGAGQLTVFRVGHKVRVPSADLLRLLGLSHAEALKIVFPDGATTGVAPADQSEDHDDEALDTTADGAL
ncbi:hypothetical protein [Tsukamurella tyrosinosolvens]|uniref:hypothetical protein n=1 Tax=Tsukamurella tyrosinosolvens TaxID=57704 RepID=UPI000DF6CE03|nr:hypothetical protein [Tsukamurella tyrosinosolvens]RDB49358.1 hypothetical protein DVB87_03245 [Tsukamurella tyrosinosolvens]